MASPDITDRVIMRDLLMSTVARLERGHCHIGPHRYEISLAAIDDWGSTDFDEQAIKLRKGAAPSMLVDALLHEIIEASNELRELKIPHRAIQALGTDLAQALLTLEIE